MGNLLFEPLEINGMKLKNRLGFAPMLNLPRDEFFHMSDLAYDWFEQRAKGGAGFITTGTFMPEHLTMMPGGPEKFKKLAEVVHKYDCKIAVQIGAGGPMSGTGPSNMPYPNETDPKMSANQALTGEFSPFAPGLTSVAELTHEQMEEHIQKFGAAAAILKDCGIDAVELHCAHGGATLYCSFISPFYNRRTDEYGGSWENRLKFPVATLKKMREAVGPDYPLLARISADELLGEQGITLDAACKHVVPALESAGIDCIDVSQGSILHSPEGITIPLYYPRGCYIHNSEAIKKASKLPVIGVGRIVDIEMAEQFLQEGKADLIYMGRQLTSDPETPNKFLNGQADEILKCIGCLEGCGTPCPVNYEILPGRIPLEKATDKKKVLVVGGGVSGMEAARICALRGYQVTLMEKDSQLGGMVATLALDPLTVEFRNLVDYLELQMKKLNIDVQLSKEVTADDVKATSPDAVIMATGSYMKIPDEVKGAPAVLDHLEALKNKDAIGQRVVIWGFVYGAELALTLADMGKDVTLIDKADRKGLTRHAAQGRKYWVARKLTDINVVRSAPEAQQLDNPKVLFRTKIKGIKDGGVKIKDEDGNKSVIPYDTLIISRRTKKRKDLLEKLKKAGVEIHRIGDCKKVGNIHRAIFSANEVARKI
jgi:2,4-dienoyl-CoA reductase-like NADH-dependent reductase (Old Yellow Enzyme family)/thioredoxin reductase